MGDTKRKTLKVLEPFTVHRCSQHSLSLAQVIAWVQGNWIYSIEINFFLNLSLTLLKRQRLSKYQISHFFLACGWHVLDSGPHQDIQGSSCLQVQLLELLTICFWASVGTAWHNTTNTDTTWQLTHLKDLTQLDNLITSDNFATLPLCLDLLLLFCYGGCQALA